MFAIYHKLLIFTISIALIPYAAIAYGATSEISGTYKCSGTDPLLTNPSFKEKLVIKKNNGTYKVDIVETSGVIPYWYATAIVNKEIEDVFAFVYWDPKKPNVKGSELLIIKPDGSLDGVFADANKNVSGKVICRKDKTQ